MKKKTGITPSISQAELEGKKVLYKHQIGPGGLGKNKTIKSNFWGEQARVTIRRRFR